MVYDPLLQQPTRALSRAQIIALIAGVGGVVAFPAGTAGQIAYFTGPATITSEVDRFTWVTITHRLGIETTAPLGAIHLAGIQNVATQMFMDAYGGGASNPGIIGRASVGAFATPSAPVLNTPLLQLLGRGWNPGTSLFTTVSQVGINLVAEETWTGASQATKILFQTTKIGATTRADRVAIHNDGEVEIATGSTRQLNLRNSSGGGTSFVDPAHAANIDYTLPSSQAPGFMYDDGTGVLSWVPIGSSGLMGIPGMDGEPGEDGMMGPPGSAGATGADGAPGDVGAMGPPGPAGEDGEDGAQGTPGIPGLAGLMGLMGPPGVDGEDGEAGPPGSAGAPGATGATGATGAAGMMGAPGADGEDGSTGAPGPQGLQGLPGIAGVPGMQGDDGDDGMIGMPGPAGARGPQGFMGPPGTDGDSADDLAPLLGIALPSSRNNIYTTTVTINPPTSLFQTTLANVAGVTASSLVRAWVYGDTGVSPTSPPVATELLDRVDVLAYPQSDGTIKMELTPITWEMNGDLGGTYQLAYEVTL